MPRPQPFPPRRSSPYLVTLGLALSLFSACKKEAEPGKETGSARGDGSRSDAGGSSSGKTTPARIPAAAIAHGGVGSPP